MKKLEYIDITNQVRWMSGVWELANVGYFCSIPSLMSSISGACVFRNKNGRIEYRYNGLLHRFDGPAIIYENGSTEYYS